MLGKKEPRIDAATIGFMFSVALFFDVLSAIPWIGIIFSILAYCTFFLWFYMKGLGVFRPKKLVVWTLSILSELGFSVVGLGVWPGITLGVLINILISRAEDFTGIEIPDKPADVAKLAQQIKNSPLKRSDSKEEAENNTDNGENNRVRTHDVTQRPKNAPHIPQRTSEAK